MLWDSLSGTGIEIGLAVQVEDIDAMFEENSSHSLDGFVDTHEIGSNQCPQPSRMACFDVHSYVARKPKRRDKEA
jgi:hypothetical protein